MAKTKEKQAPSSYNEPPSDINISGEVTWNQERGRFETGGAKYFASVRYPGGGSKCWNLSAMCSRSLLSDVWCGCDLHSR